MDIDRKFTYSNIISLQNESRKTPLKLFPNPTHDIVFIEAENREQPFVLYNATGQVLYQANTIPYKLDMTIQAAGLYFLKVKQEELSNSEVKTKSAHPTSDVRFFMLKNKVL